uniref:Biogenesis of lysosome-related organelles complex 1 subunit 1 n=1 Tax=Oryza nivara TaxID=4536 RepID=A0A0E0J9K7_ORYNI
MLKTLNPGTRQAGNLKWRCSRSCNATTTNPSVSASKLRAKMDAVRSAARVADLLVATVDGGVQELYINEKRIELEARALLATIAWYRKQTDQWLAATNAINCLEDFENWMKIMDFDCERAIVNELNVGIKPSNDQCQHDSHQHYDRRSKYDAIVVTGDARFTRLHVHQLELEKTNLLFPGTLYPLQEIDILLFIASDSMMGIIIVSYAAHLIPLINLFSL